MSDSDELNFLDLSRYLSQKHLSDYCGVEVSLAEFEKTDRGGSEIPVYGFWMSFILLFCEDLNVILKIHYNETDVLPLVKNIANSSTGGQTFIVTGYMNEFMNLLGTKVKNSLLDASVATGMSLPVLSRGFDNFLFEEYSRKQMRMAGDHSDAGMRQMLDVWTLKFGSHKVHISMDVSVFSKGVYKRLNKMKKTREEEINVSHELEDYLL